MDTKQLRELADNTFTKRGSLINLWQEIAEHLYPERADFTTKRYLGDDFAGNLMTSYPVLARRDMSDQIGTMLRNTNKPWFNMVAADHGREDHESKAWLEWATGTMRRAMYAPSTLFTKATSQGDADYAAFGQTIITVRLNRNADDLLYRCWHLRDMAWIEDEDGKICGMFRRWKPSYRTMVRMFDGKPGSRVHEKVIEQAVKTPNEECECYHFMVASDMYDGADKGMPWCSIYYDIEHECEMEIVHQKNREYVIPRWLTVSGSQYAHSPATVAALPEARLLQSMTYTLLEAGEKIVNPPMVATEQAIRSDVALYAGGLTYVDMEYDERSGAALRALTQDSRGMPLSQEMQRDSRQLIAQCFYLNKLMLPQRTAEMTAYEVGQRVQEYIRNALPLFEPMEAEYNGALCEETFAVGLQAGLFGSPMDMPRRLRGADVEFRFSSPLHDAIDAQKGSKFLEMKQLLAEAVALDPTAAAVVDSVTALRDALSGIGVPTKWTRSEQQANAIVQDQAAKQQTADLLARMQQGAGVAKDLATAQSLAPAQQTAP
jgi:Bacteriophage head to tail connecting protein.